MKVDFLDLKTQYKNIKKDVDNAIQNVIENTAFIGGNDLNSFNEEFTSFIGTKYGFGVGNGTDALILALHAMGVGKGDKVIVPANSFIASSEAVTAVGAEVVFIDCDPNYYTLDTSKLKEVFTTQKNIKAIIAVHLYGQPAKMDEIMSFANENDLLVLEDCAQAHGAMYHGKKIGTFGDMACFSFYPGKNLGAYGDGGFIVTNNENYYIKAKMFANHGRVKKYSHEFEGYNSRLDNLQAAILRVKLPNLDNWNAGRRAVAKKYYELLNDCKQIVLPKIIDDIQPVYHLFVIRAEKREELRKFLSDNQISTGIHYPIGLPFLQAYDYMKHDKKDFPVTFENQDKLLSLPIYAELTNDKVEYICSKIKEFYN